MTLQVLQVNEFVIAAGKVRIVSFITPTWLKSKLRSRVMGALKSPALIVEYISVAIRYSPSGKSVPERVRVSKDAPSATSTISPTLLISRNLKSTAFSGVRSKPTAVNASVSHVRSIIRSPDVRLLMLKETVIGVKAALAVDSSPI